MPPANKWTSGNSPRQPIAKHNSARVSAGAYGAYQGHADACAARAHGDADVCAAPQLDRPVNGHADDAHRARADAHAPSSHARVRADGLL